MAKGGVETNLSQALDKEPNTTASTKKKKTKKKKSEGQAPSSITSKSPTGEDDKPTYKESPSKLEREHKRELKDRKHKKEKKSKKKDEKKKEKRHEQESKSKKSGETTKAASSKQKIKTSRAATSELELEAKLKSGFLPSEASTDRNAPPDRSFLLKRQRSKKVSARKLKELDKEFEPRVYDKPVAVLDMITHELKRAIKLKDPNDEHLLKRLALAFEPTSVYQKGEVVLRAGDEQTHFQIIASGCVDYVAEDEVVGSASVGHSFGRMALAFTSPSKVTVRSTSNETSLLRIDERTFRYILQSHTKFGHVWRRSFQKVKAANRLRLLSGLSKKGQLFGTKTTGQQDGSSEFFSQQGGESLDIGEFAKTLSSEREVIQSSVISVDDLKRKDLLGEGQFGEVWAVEATFGDQEVLRNAEFALKIQSKADMASMYDCSDNSPSETVRRECDIMSQLCHPFVVRHLHDFEDVDSFYMMMDLIRGEELWNVIHRETEDGTWISGIPEVNAKFYGLIVCDTLNFIHQKRICYRDLKPPNIMVNETGYPIMVDFGCAKQITADVTFTFCGTPEYTCPEMISNQGHGFAVDHWALGIVISEMITGENPFYYDGISNLQLLSDISHKEPYLSDKLSPQAKDLVENLLAKDQNERLGSVERGGREILDHAWFQDAGSVQKARTKELSAPYLPKVRTI